MRHNTAMNRKRNRKLGLILFIAFLLASLVIPIAVSHQAIVQADSHCEGEFHSVSLPLTDLGSDYYIRYETTDPTEYTGGLYPNGSNTRPPEHDAAGISLANQVEPLNTYGQADPENGHIVMVSVGMSNTAAEFIEFILLANADEEVNPKLAVVNGAQPGQTTDIWENPDVAVW